jgi:hypothetical protein
VGARAAGAGRGSAGGWFLRGGGGDGGGRWLVISGVRYRGSPGAEITPGGVWWGVRRKERNLIELKRLVRVLTVIAVIGFGVVLG